MNSEYVFYMGEANGAKVPHRQFNRCFPFTVIVYVCKGCYHCEIDGKAVDAKQGETLIVPPYKYHHIWMNESGCLNWAHITMSVNGHELTAESIIPYKLTGDISIKAGEYLKKLVFANESDDSKLKTVKIQKYIASLYDIILSAGTESKTSKKLADIKTIMEKCPGEKYTVEYFAQLAGTSVRSFENHFKKEYGITPIKYLNDCKIKYATYLLASGKKVVEVAEITGYYDAYHFSKQFKKIIGIPPSEYARTHTIDV